MNIYTKHKSLYDTIMFNKKPCLGRTRKLGRLYTQLAIQRIHLYRNLNAITQQIDTSLI